MKKKIRIFLVDDHLIVRDGLKALFKDEEGFEIVGESDGGDGIAAIQKTLPDIVLMDISLGKISGIELTRKLLAENNKLKVIMLSMLGSEEVVLNATEAGAKGYLPKSTSKDAMIKAIETVCNGGTYFHSEIAEVMIASLMQKKRTAQDEQPCVDCLSKREIEIIELYAQGFTNQEIAAQLFISTRTVESHKTHIMQKLGFKSSVEMVKFAIRHKLIDIN
jgi:DNA-binding NarL/FixJ family response regulator